MELICRDHNATSYSTETQDTQDAVNEHQAEIITLRAIALKLRRCVISSRCLLRRDHNATSYSTETYFQPAVLALLASRDHNATSYSTETMHVRVPNALLGWQRS